MMAQHFGHQAVNGRRAEMHEQASHRRLRKQKQQQQQQQQTQQQQQ
jgi:hypothetical protein